MGNVKTNITKPWIVLPESSMYQPIKAEYQSRRIDNFHGQCLVHLHAHCTQNLRSFNPLASAIAREPVAQGIVAEILKTKPRAWFWTSANSWVAWLISTFLGRRVFVSIFEFYHLSSTLIYFRLLGWDSKQDVWPEKARCDQCDEP